MIAAIAASKSLFPTSRIASERALRRRSISRHASRMRERSSARGLRPVALSNASMSPAKEPVSLSNAALRWFIASESALPWRMYASSIAKRAASSST